MESKELIVRKNNNHAYVFLLIVFIVSVIGSIIYFSNGKNTSEEINNNSSVYFISGDSGELIFIQGTASESSIDNVQQDEEQIVFENEPQETSQKIVENPLQMEIPNKIVEKSSIRQLDKNKPMVALTFDDGPDPKRTAQIIEILNQYDARATFFDIGNLVDKYPDTAKLEVQSGCDVGGHTYSHVNLNNLSKSEIQEEIGKLEKAFHDATGQNIKFIRPTYGNANALVKETVKYPLINWCIDSLDWKSRDTDKVLEEIYETENFDGKIIIMHVIYDSTVDAVKKLVPDLVKKGYQLVTISEMAAYKGVTLENGKVYYQF